MPSFRVSLLSVLTLPSLLMLSWAGFIVFRALQHGLAGDIRSLLALLALALLYAGSGALLVATVYRTRLGRAAVAAAVLPFVIVPGAAMVWSMVFSKL